MCVSMRVLAWVLIAAPDAGVPGLASTFFPEEASFDVSQRAIVRSDKEMSAAAIGEAAARTKKLLAWTLCGMNERPLRSYGGAEACRLVLVMHRSIVVATLVSRGDANTLVLKQYAQGSTDSGIGVDATRTRKLDRGSAEGIRAGFAGTGLWERGGFRRNEAYQDGEANPLIGIWFAECARGEKYGDAMFESPVARTGAEGEAVKATLERILDAGGRDFLTQRETAEMF
jgi:hypothetical protein